MACRVGITTDPRRREEEWRQKYPNLHGWEILGKYPTKSDAQEREKQEAGRRGCVAHAGGDDPDYANALWHVYYFQH